MKELDLILKNIKNKEFLPIYFFHGEEPYFMDVALKSFENDVLEEDEKAFNQTVVYGKDTTFSEVLSLARQFPMMGDKQVIIVKEAQDIVLTEADSTALKLYTENPVESTLLVIAYKYKKVDARKAFTKILSTKKMLFLSEKIKDYNVSKWIDSEIKTLGLKAKPNIPTILAEYLGTDLSRISNELQKLKMILKDGEILDEKIIETNIGISKDFNVFELIKALGKKDEVNAFKIAHYMGKSKTHAFVMTTGNLYNFFSNLILFHTMKGESPQNQAAAMGINPFFLKDFGEAARFYNLKHCTRAISILREIDLKSKGLGAINMTDNDLLKELVYKILHIDHYKVQL
ncbi:MULTISPECIES: DNA polymerase III subunit delta [unclassified Kaistella]|uniref:DNA polymerase III subunit delta n=1 Tax=unclassified Kaistella TaxID=2762626 RepID=UPI0027369CEE|nr:MULTISPECIES: DNA polymerase III subunit delta [unclassified Kaistella]MDP2454724.1 DNA polymerase III subunit delta [Kaistella sp. SH11-4b]MDP2457461.1 DNA polymerase III subunit delta [Kaistella sp. SH40-3]MDP2460221.1 DNA polymerase III subunit delta [Kaistella sp. SH19-2b]